MKNIFIKSVTDEVITRINNLTTTVQPKWGKMNVAQIMAHFSVTYEGVYTDSHQKPKGLIKFVLKSFIKRIVVF